jgi:hypothetical protein
VHTIHLESVWLAHMLMLDGRDLDALRRGAVRASNGERKGRKIHTTRQLKDANAIFSSGQDRKWGA